MRIRLTVTKGPHQGQSFAFEHHDMFLVGRSSRAHFRLPSKDKFFSRIHFMIELNPPQCRLSDMESRNGTFLNGKRVTTADLKDGDVIKGGATVMEVSVEAGKDPEPQQPIGEMQTLLPTLSASAIPVPGPQAVPAPSPQAEPAPSRRAVPAPSRQLKLPASSPSVSKGSKWAPNCCLGCNAEMPAANPAGKSVALARLCPPCQEQVQRQPQPFVGYQIVKELGKGGMGVVYLAMAADGRLVALKTVVPGVPVSQLEKQRFLREASILKQLDHPNIIAFRDMGEADGRLFFAMDFIRGTDAARLLKENREPLAVPRAARLICQLLDALEYAHGLGFVHRDIKPQNMLVMVDGNGVERVKLADFGLARVYQASQMSGLTMHGNIGGTLAFIAPEQITNFRECKPAADQYSAAASLYHLLTGRFVYDLAASIPKQIMLILEQECVPILQRRPELAQGLSDLIHRGLAKNEDDRYPNVGEMRQALEEFCT